MSVEPFLVTSVKTRQEKIAALLAESKALAAETTHELFQATEVVVKLAREVATSDFYAAGVREETRKMAESLEQSSARVQAILTRQLGR